MITDKRNDIDKFSSQNLCLFRDPWKKTFDTRSQVWKHTDADLAAEMNALSFEQQRQDIHGVSDDIEEAPEFVNQSNVRGVDELNIATERTIASPTVSSFFAIQGSSLTNQNQDFPFHRKLTVTYC